MNHFEKPGVYIIGVGQLKVEKTSPLTLREMGAKAIKLAMQDADIDKVDAVYVGNMLSGMISHQQQLAPIVASEAGLNGVEAVTLEAACGSGGASLRNGFMSIMSGLCDQVVVCGLEKMNHSDKEFVTQSIATASDWEIEGGKGESFVTLNAGLMRQYIDHYKLSSDLFGMFGVNAHDNANKNEHALFHKVITIDDYLNAKFIVDCLRIYDASPICDGSAAVVLSKFPPKDKSKPHIKIIASAAASEYVGIANRPHPLDAEGIKRSGEKAYAMAGISAKDVDFFELHDAYSIIAVLSLEAMGFANKGEGWKLAVEGEIALDGKIPISTFGGLKARGHPIGASGVYQTVEAYLQLTHQADQNQIKKDVKIGLIQSIGGTASSIITHVLARN
ncbi:MAG TPA: beta-ketoacyl synthase N-terminal-like domain-containing protein [Chitinophagaceae bacterium]|nr:beta-ketoacyl synthase N-terminal-like domain-containing protein [Chitinophagaceae bacterium]